VINSPACRRQGVRRIHKIEKNAFTSKKGLPGVFGDYFLKFVFPKIQKKAYNTTMN
jgi:hypothetical protein